MACTNKKKCLHLVERKEYDECDTQPNFKLANLLMEQEVVNLQNQTPNLLDLLSIHQKLGFDWGKVRRTGRKRKCAQCGSVQGIEEMYFLEACFHCFCRPCLVTFIQSKIQHGNCSELVCFVCSSPFLQSDMRNLLEEKENEKYLKKSVEEVLNSGTLRVIRCPNIYCGVAMEKLPSKDLHAQNWLFQDKTSNLRDSRGNLLSRESFIHREEHRFRCRECTTEFCGSCGSMPYHLGFTCLQFKKWKNSKHCRFCGSTVEGASGSGIKGPQFGGDQTNAPFHCEATECVKKAAKACHRLHPCGHPCLGIKDEIKCLPCLEPECVQKGGEEVQKSTDLCCICYVEDLSSAPCIRLNCSHVFHYECCCKKIENSWSGSRITFGFLDCALCKARMEHPALYEVLNPWLELFDQVQEKALQRLRMETLDELPYADHSDPAAYAMQRFSFYVCFKCRKPYFGGDKQLCGMEENIRDFNAEELICGSCCDFSDKDTCPEHGTEFIEYKCRYCCNMAVWFCWGTSHFCDECHKNAVELLTAKPEELPPCTCGVSHPPNGEEYSFGCSYCKVLYS